MLTGAMSTIALTGSAITRSNPSEADADSAAHPIIDYNLALKIWS